MSLKPPLFETLFLSLAGPTDLAANTTILPAELPSNFGAELDESAFATREVFVQCLAGSARWRESAASPGANAPGHILGAGDGVVITLQRGRPFWFWRAEDGTNLAVSPAASTPTRDATFDVASGS